MRLSISTFKEEGLNMIHVFKKLINKNKDNKEILNRIKSSVDNLISRNWIKVISSYPFLMIIKFLGI